MENVLIYPFDKEFLPFLERKSLLEDFNVTSVISPIGWGYCEKIVGNNIIVLDEENFSSNIEKVDYLWIVESENDVDFERDIIPKVKIALEMGKKVLYLKELTKSEKVILENLKKSNNIMKLQKSLLESNLLDLKLFDINVPIILILGTSANTDKFSIQLGIHDQLTTLGYNVSVLGSKKEGEILGFYSINNILDSSKNEIEKIITINHTLKEIEKEESPDAIILGIPGGILPLSKKFLNGWNILGGPICQSISPDCIILCTSYDKYLTDKIKVLNSSIQGILGKEINFYHISACMIDIEESVESNNLEYLSLDSSFVLSKLNSIKQNNLYCLDSKEELKRIVEDIIDLLSNYSKVKYI